MYGFAQVGPDCGRHIVLAPRHQHAFLYGQGLNLVGQFFCSARPAISANGVRNASILGISSQQDQACLPLAATPNAERNWWTL